MDSYAIARAENRIAELEREVRELRSDAERRRWDEMFRPAFLVDFFLPLLWFAACGLAGIGISWIILELLGVD